MLGRIVKFRRGDKYEDLEGDDAVSRPVHAGPSAGGQQLVIHRRPGSSAAAASASQHGDSEAARAAAAIPDGKLSIALMVL